MSFIDKIFKINQNTPHIAFTDSVPEEKNLESNKPIFGLARFFSGINKDKRTEKTKRTVFFTPQEYDLAHIEAIFYTDGYFKQFVSKILQRMFKNEISLVGDPKQVNYINKRIGVMETYIDRTFRQWLEDVSSDLIKFGNVFLEKVRNKHASKRLWRTTEYKNLVAPIAYCQRISPPTVKIGASIHGQPIKYQQLVADRSNSGGYVSNSSLSLFEEDFPTWDPINIFHIFMDKDSNMLYGAPIVVQTLDDFKAIRYMEEASEILVFQFSKPTLKYKIGTEKRQDIFHKDFTDAEEALKHMATYGYLILPGHHDAEYIGANQKAINTVPILEWFKNRIYVGLGLDKITMGEGDTSNRNTAQSMSENMVYLVRRFQTLIAEHIENTLFKEWLQEAGYAIGSVKIFFPEIDLNSKQMTETHLISLFQSNAITHEELRKGMGLDPLPSNKDLYIERIQKPLAEMEAKEESAQQKKIQSQTKPTNQYNPSGKPKPKVAKDNIYLEEL